MKLRPYCVTVTGIALLAVLPSVVLAHGNARGQDKLVINGATITLTYGRPTLKGRDISKMIQPGQLWRLGADIPTTFQSSADLSFGRVKVPKGKYILLARLIEPGKWTLIFSTKSVFQYEPSVKVAEVPLELRQEKDPIETLKINLTNKSGRGELEIAWGTYRLLSSFTRAK